MAKKDWATEYQIHKEERARQGKAPMNYEDWLEYRQTHKHDFSNVDFDDPVIKKYLAAAIAVILSWPDKE